MCTKLFSFCIEYILIHMIWIFYEADLTITDKVSGSFVSALYAYTYIKASGP